MERKYYCTNCNAQLNVGADIIFTVKTNNQNSGLLLVSPQVGNYNVKKDPLFEISEGEKLEIICPVCHHNCQENSKYNNLSRVKMIDDNGILSDIYFSEIFGEKCTYKVTESEVEVFGDDSKNYNFWGEEFKY